MNMPEMGSKMPNMGSTKSKPASALAPAVSLADALFAGTQQRVLAYLFGQPDRSFYATELIGLTGGGSGAVQRELARLAGSGLVTVTRVGNQKHYQANPAAPIYTELCGIAMKTVGLAEPLRQALAPLARQIVAACVFGSVAKRGDTAASDIDVLVLTYKLDYADVFATLQAVEMQLARPVNPTLYSRADWRRKRKEGHTFVSRIMAQPKIMLIGTEADLD
jgi:predicted nucleotidyltransferase